MSSVPCIGARFTPIATWSRNYDPTKPSRSTKSSLPHHQSAHPATCTMRSGRPSFIAPPVKSNKALEDIRNLLAGTCPAPPTDEVTAANVGSRSNAFAAAEGAPTNPILTLHRACCPCCPSPSPSDGLVSRLLAARRGPSESYAPYASPAHSRPAAVRTMAMLTMAMVTMQTSRSARPRSCTTPRRRCSWRPPCRVRRGAISPRPERSPCTPAPRRAAPTLTLALTPNPSPNPTLAVRPALTLTVRLALTLILALARTLTRCEDGPVAQG